MNFTDLYFLFYPVMAQMNLGLEKEPLIFHFHEDCSGYATYFQWSF